MGSEIKRGDWVRFLSAGRVVIGAVQYVRPQAMWPGRMEVITDTGIVNAEDILEVR